MIAHRSAPLLRPRLDAVRAESRCQMRPEQRRVLDRLNDWLDDSGRLGAALQPGERVADFALSNQHGLVVRLAERLARGPVVLVFFRGLWCPYCRLTLEAWQESLGPLRDAGGSLLALSPQSPDACARLARTLGLQYDLLSDLGSEIAGAMRLAYPLPADLRGFYLQLGLRLEEFNGGDASELPMPATFVLDASASVRLADVHGDPTRRLEPAEAIAAVAALRAEHRAG